MEKNSEEQSEQKTEAKLETEAAGIKQESLSEKEEISAVQENPTKEEHQETTSEEKKLDDAEEKTEKDLNRTGSAMTPDNELAEVSLEETREATASRSDPIEAPEKTKKGCCVIS